MQPPSGSAPITLTATRHKSTGNTSFQVESDFSQARMLASWGSSDYTIAASGDKYLITAGGKVYTFTPGSVGLGVPLPTVVAEYEVTTVDSLPRPVSAYSAQFAVRNFVAIVFGGGAQFGDFSSPFSLLFVSTPSTVAPEDPWDIMMWLNWNSDDLGGATQPLATTLCNDISGDEVPIPASAIWSFGNLLTYPSVPVIG